VLKQEANTAADILEIEWLDSESKCSLCYRGSNEVINFGQTWPRLEDVIKLLLAQRFERFLCVHGANLLTPDGSVVIFLGPTNSGKTTIARALVDGGDFSMIDDDLTFVDWRTGQVTFRGCREVDTSLYDPEKSKRVGVRPTERNLLIRDISSIWTLCAPGGAPTTIERTDQWEKIMELVLGRDEESKARFKRETLLRRTRVDFESNIAAIRDESRVSTLRTLLQLSLPCTERRIDDVISSVLTWLPRKKCYALCPGELGHTVEFVKSQIGSGE